MARVLNDALRRVKLKSQWESLSVVRRRKIWENVRLTRLLFLNWRTRVIGWQWKRSYSNDEWEKKRRSNSEKKKSKSSKICSDSSTIIPLKDQHQHQQSEQMVSLSLRSNVREEEWRSSVCLEVSPSVDPLVSRSPSFPPLDDGPSPLPYQRFSSTDSQLLNTGTGTERGKKNDPLLDPLSSSSLFSPEDNSLNYPSSSPLTPHSIVSRPSPISPHLNEPTTTTTTTTSTPTPPTATTPGSSNVSSNDQNNRKSSFNRSLPHSLVSWLFFVFSFVVCTFWSTIFSSINILRFLHWATNQTLLPSRRDSLSLTMVDRRSRRDRFQHALLFSDAQLVHIPPGQMTHSSPFFSSNAQDKWVHWSRTSVKYYGWLRRGEERRVFTVKSFSELRFARTMCLPVSQHFSLTREKERFSSLDLLWSWSRRWLLLWTSLWLLWRQFSAGSRRRVKNTLIRHLSSVLLSLIVFLAQFAQANQRDSIDTERVSSSSSSSSLWSMLNKQK